MKKNLFCYNAWTYSQVLTTGQIGYCCFAKDSLLQSPEGGSISVQHSPSAEALMNSKKQRDVRSQLMRGEFPTACALCKEAEAVGGHSPRLALESGLSKYLSRDRLLEQTNEDGTLVHPQLNYLELRLGNLCNLRCRFCGPHSSSSWYKDFEKLYGTDIFSEGTQKISTSDRDFFEWPSSEQFMRWFLSVADSLLNLQFAGGEPLLSQVHEPLLKLLIESKKSQKINLIYITNGTFVDPKLFDLWRNFQSVTVFVSVDGLDKIYEYQRWPAKWAPVQKNIELLESQVGQAVTQLFLQPMINVYNVATISELAIWCLQRSDRLNWAKHVSFLREPSWQAAYILQQPQKAEVRNKIANDIALIQSSFVESSRRALIVEWLESVRDILIKQDWTELRADFELQNRKLDQIRNSAAVNYLDPLTLSFL